LVIKTLDLELDPLSQLGKTGTGSALNQYGSTTLRFLLNNMPELDQSFHPPLIEPRDRQCLASPGQTCPGRGLNLRPPWLEADALPKSYLDS